ncbi:oxidoreductase [Stenotrophomonas sp.]|uniref:oxidoreductase n=1 Tax=Stenotrophomonas sp. TaxID=69392 RepID=UPI0028AC6C45|nr:oxidoreductase [Stenotrophomonas sp.]
MVNDGGRLKIVLTGASGLVGQGVALACAGSVHVRRTVALVRHAGGLVTATEELVLDDFLQAHRRQADLVGFDACFYCAGAPPLGTAEDAYRRVTLDTTLAVAQTWFAANPQGMFLYVSGAHANPESHLMPLRIKGETERALARLPGRTVMLRPGGVRPVAGTGSRHALLKPLYVVGGPMMQLTAAVLPSMFTSNLVLGRAMIALAGMPDPPAVVECRQINQLGNADAG